MPAWTLPFKLVLGVPTDVVGHAPYVICLWAAGSGLPLSALPSPSTSPSWQSSKPLSSSGLDALTLVSR